MLTKNLLKYRTRSERVYPTFIKKDHPDFEGLAKDLLACFNRNIGSTVAELNGELEHVSCKDKVLKKGLEKLIFDKCEVEVDDQQIAEKRWDYLNAAEEIRKNVNDINSFYDVMKSKLNEPLTTMQQSLYGDLPDFKILHSYPDFDCQSLKEKYNLSQLQGLILRARDLVLLVENASNQEMRFLFRKIRFHQLLAEIEKTNSGYLIKFSGPLSIFEASQTYGLNMARFIGNIFELKTFNLTANIKINQKSYRLEIDDKSPLSKNHGQLLSPMNEEWQMLVDRFNEKHAPLKACLGNDVIDLGGQHFCFPDLSIRTMNQSKVVHFEFFHKWHQALLLKRLDQISTSNTTSLRIGVAKSLTKSQKIKEYLNQSRWFADFGFEFSRFPTAKQLFDKIS